MLVSLALFVSLMFRRKLSTEFVKGDITRENKKKGRIYIDRVYSAPCIDRGQERPDGKAKTHRHKSKNTKTPSQPNLGL